MTAVTPDDLSAQPCDIPTAQHDCLIAWATATCPYSTEKQSTCPPLPCFWVAFSGSVFLHGCKHPLAVHEHCPLFYTSLKPRCNSNPGNTNPLLRRWANTTGRKPPVDSRTVPFFFPQLFPGGGQHGQEGGGGAPGGRRLPPAGRGPGLVGAPHGWAQRVPSGRKRAPPLPTWKPCCRLGKIARWSETARRSHWGVLASRYPAFLCPATLALLGLRAGSSRTALEITTGQFFNKSSKGRERKERNNMETP